MPLLPTPALSRAEKDALIAALTAKLALADQRIAAQDAHIAAQDARIAALEARLNQLTQRRRPPATRLSRRRKDRNQTCQPPARIARRAKAVPVSDGHCIRTRIARSTSFWPPVRNARRSFPTHSKPHSRSTNASSCHRSDRM